MGRVTFQNNQLTGMTMGIASEGLDGGSGATGRCSTIGRTLPDGVGQLRAIGTC